MSVSSHILCTSFLTVFGVRVNLGDDVQTLAHDQAVGNQLEDRGHLLAYQGGGGRDVIVGEEVDLFQSVCI